MVEDIPVIQGGDDRLTFESFQVEPTNREAFERCRDVADMRPQSPNLLVLLGKRGAGKTHLLRGIVHRVRSRRVPSAIAAISDAQFPDEVRALVTDPGPIDALPFAVLLVDGLDRVSRKFDDVTPLIKMFLKLDFPVVVTLEAPLGNSSSMPDELKALVDGSDEGAALQLRSWGKPPAWPHRLPSRSRSRSLFGRWALGASYRVGSFLWSDHSGLRCKSTHVPTNSEHWPVHEVR